MKFGIFDQNDATGRDLTQQYEERLVLAQLYEELGFSRYQLSEHHGTPLNTSPSPSVFLAALAQRTKTLRFGPLVYLLPIYHPLRLTEEICMLDHLSGGRFEFGVGRGASPHEIRYLGVDPEQAAAMHTEAFAIIHQGLATGRIDYRGAFWSFDDVHLSLRPAQTPHPPIWYAVGSPDSTAWPAQRGINIMCGGPAQRVRAISDRYRAEYHAQGDHDPGDRSDDACAPLIGINRWAVVAETDAEAKALAARAWPVFFASFIKLWRRHGGEPKAMLSPDFEVVAASGNAVAGAPDTVARVLADQVATGGLNFLSASFSFGDLTFDEVSRSARLFARDVMPAVREAQARAAPSLALAS